MRTAQAEGKVEKTIEHKLDEKNQFALEIDHFADCVSDNLQPYTPGEEGLQDHRIMEAIYESARLNRPVKLTASSRKDEFRGPKPRGLS